MHLVRPLATLGIICVAAAASGCAPAGPGRPPRILTVRPTSPYRLFPIMRGHAADSVTCAPTGPPDSAVEYQRAETDSRYLGALSLRLPPEYVLMAPPSAGPRSEVAGGILVAAWRATTDGGPAGSRERAVSAWVVPESGLPGVGADPGTRQVAVAECAGGAPVRRARAVVFTLVTGAESTAYLAAVWPLTAGRNLQLVASAPGLAELVPVRRALLDARTEPPPSIRR